jgi:N-acetylneuraminic acid mutarotase
MSKAFQPAGQELRSTNRPIYGAASISISNTTYIYGGFYNTPPWNKEALWTLSHSTQELQQLPTNPHLSPAVIYHTLEAFNDTLFSFGGHDTSIPANTTEPLRYYALDIKHLTWKPLQKTLGNATSPLERYWHTTVSINSTVYLMGGMNTTHPQLDTWKYDAKLDQWSLLMNGDASNRCGHTSTMLKYVPLYKRLV